MPRRLLNEKKKTIGLRIPENKIALALLEELAEPLLTTSLILPGQEFAESDPDEMRHQLERQVDLILHGGIIGEDPTTVVDLSEDAPQIIRQGRGDSRPFE